MKFKTLCSRAVALDQNPKHNRYEGLALRVGCVLDSASQNAHETDYGAGRAPTEKEFDRAAVTSVETLLSYSTDVEVAAWFRRQGFRW